MTGPEHYRRAEALQRLAIDQFERGARTLADLTMRQAQVHSGLAQVAATIDAAAHAGQSQVDFLGQWWEAIR